MGKDGVIANETNILKRSLILMLKNQRINGQMGNV